MNGGVVRGIDYYDLLGVERDATQAQLRSAYRALAKALHPDAGGTAGAFRLLRDAYETLTDPVRRAEYDRGDEPPPPPPPPPPRRKFGADPEFVPTLPEVTDIPWWEDAPRPVSVSPDLAPHPGIVAATAAAAVVVLVVLGWLGAPVVVWVVVLAGILGAAADVVRRSVSARRADREFDAEFAGQVIFGQPGSEDDEVAERLTAELLDRYLTRLPGVRIFHGLAAEAGSVFADLNHAVLCGRRLVLVESKSWLPGHYEVDDDGNITRNGHPFRGGAMRLPALISAYRALLPGLEIRGALLIYPSRSGAVTANGGPAYTPARFVTEVGGWLATDPSTVDRQMFRALRRQVVSTG